MPASIFNGSAVKLLKNILRFKDGVEITSTEAGYLANLTGDVQDQLNDKIDTTEKGAANGVAELDAGGKVPASQLPNSIMDYLGTWAASTNTPTLANGVGNAGDVYVASDAGTVNFGAGNITFAAGDWVIYSGSVWQRSINSNAVASVNGFTGAVSLDTDDINEGVTNEYFTDARAQAAITGGASSIVTADLTSDRALASDGSGKVSASSVTATELGYVSGVTSAIQTQLNGKADTDLSNLEATTAINSTLNFATTIPGIVKTNDEASGASTALTLQSGDTAGAGASGSVTLESGITTGIHTSGDVTVASGNYSGVGSGASGDVNILSGSSVNTASGDVSIRTGNTSSGNSGNIVVQTGTASGTRGTITLDAPTISAASNKISNVGDPVSAQDASTKAYSDEINNRRVRNYLETLYSGASISGINQYQDAAAAVPVDGTGGSPAGLTTALNITTELRRASSQRLSKDAANRQGMGWSIDIEVDRQDYEGGKPLFVSFGYETSANYVSGDVRLFAYDITNATLLNVNSLNGDGSLVASPDPSRFTGVFYPASSSSSYRIIAHIASTNASAWDLDVIDLSVSPQSVVPGAIAADLGTEVWTLNNVTGNSTVRLSRIANRIFVDGTINVTGAASGSISLTIPAAYRPSSTDYPGITSVNIQMGMTRILDAGTSTFDGVMNMDTTNLYFAGLNVASTYGFASTTSATVTHTWASGDKILFQTSWIVSGWAASAALSTTETLFSTAKARYGGGTQTIAQASATILNASTKTFDTLNSVTTGASWKFTAPKSGYYKLSASVQYVSRTYADGNLIVLQLFKNGVFASQGSGWEASGTPTILTSSAHVDTLYLAKNDYIDFRAYNEGSGGTNTDGFIITVEEQPDFSNFSTYGTFELLTATSSVKTPSATNNFHQLTNGSLTLTPGTWELSATAEFGNSGSSPTYTQVGGGWFSTNGGDSSSTPTALSSASGLTILTAGIPYIYQAPVSGSAGYLAFPNVKVRVTQPVTVYLVTYATMTTAANARITAYANAERLQ